MLLVKNVVHLMYIVEIVCFHLQACMIKIHFVYLRTFYPFIIYSSNILGQILDILKYKKNQGLSSHCEWIWYISKNRSIVKALYVWPNQPVAWLRCENIHFFGTATSKNAWMLKQRWYGLFHCFIKVRLLLKWCLKV